MPYTTQGFMTPDDLADHGALHDTGRNPDCPGHDDPDTWPGTIYCSVAQICPDEDLEDYYGQDLT